jgi:hypothetical protein
MVERVSTRAGEVADAMARLVPLALRVGLRFVAFEDEFSMLAKDREGYCYRITVEELPRGECR